MSQAIASLVDNIRNEFSRAHPALPDKAWLAAEVTKLSAAVESLPDAPTAQTAAPVTPVTAVPNAAPAGAGVQTVGVANAPQSQDAAAASAQTAATGEGPIQKAEELLEKGVSALKSALTGHAAE